MIGRDGQLSGPGVLNGLWREGALFGPPALQRALAHLGLALPWLMLVLPLGGNTTHWASVGAATAMLGALVMVGTALLAAQVPPPGALATGERRVLGRAWHHGLVVAMLIGLVAVAVGAFGAPLLALLGQPAAVVDALRAWLFTLSLGVVALLVAASTASVLLLAGRVWPVVMVVVLVNLLVAAAMALRPAALFVDGQPDPHGVALLAVLLAWACAMLLAALAWWQPDHRRMGLRKAFGGLGPQPSRRDGPSLLGSALVAAAWWALVLVTGALDELSLAALTGLGALLLPCVAVGQALAVTGGRRVGAVLAGASKKPGSVSRCGQRGAWLTLLALLAPVLLTSQALPMLLPAMLAPTALLWLLLQCLPLGLAAVVAQALFSLRAQGLRSLDQDLRVDLVRVLAALGSVPLAWWLAVVLETGLLGVVAAHALCTGVAALVLGRLFRLAAGAVDANAARQMQARAQAIALGWADTVMVSPAAAAQAKAFGPMAARKARAR